MKVTAYVTTILMVVMISGCTQTTGNIGSSQDLTKCLDEKDGYFVNIEERCKDLQVMKCHTDMETTDDALCFLKLAMQYEDEEICENFNDLNDTLHDRGFSESQIRINSEFLTSEYWTCRAVVTKNQAYCSNASPNYYDSCVNSV